MGPTLEGLRHVHLGLACVQAQCRFGHIRHCHHSHTGALRVLAIDYGIWARIDSELNSAANAAALNAVKIAAVAELNNDPNAVAEGNAAGLAWFESEAGGPQAYLVPSACSGKGNGSACTITATVKTTLGTKATSTVSFNGRIDSIFGKLFLVNSYPVRRDRRRHQGYCAVQRSDHSGRQFLIHGHRRDAHRH